MKEGYKEVGEFMCDIVSFVDEEFLPKLSKSFLRIYHGIEIWVDPDLEVVRVKLYKKLDK
jgi:hypothetical protein